MIVYTSPEGCYGSLGQAIREAQLLIDNLSKPETSAAFYRDFPKATLGVLQLPPMGAAQIEVEEVDDRLRITAVECDGEE